MNRREFLLLKTVPSSRTVVLSCEELYMRYLDSRLDGSTSKLFDNLADDLRRTDEVHLTNTSWLSEPSLKQALDPVLDSFQQRGGRLV